VNSDRLAMVQASGIASAGRTNLVRHLKGERLTQRQAILAKCADCTCCHVDGRLDCRMPHCPLYSWMPYRDDRPSSKKAISSRRRPPATPWSDGTSSDGPEGGR